MKKSDDVRWRSGAGDENMKRIPPSRWLELIPGFSSGCIVGGFFKKDRSVREIQKLGTAIRCENRIKIIHSKGFWRWSVTVGVSGLLGFVLVEFFIHEYTMYTVAVYFLRGSKERCWVTTGHGTTMHDLLQTVQRVFSLRSVPWLYIWDIKKRRKFISWVHITRYITEIHRYWSIFKGNLLEIKKR
jgi:hypothetical protein